MSKLRLPLRLKVAAFALVLTAAVTALPAVGAFYADRRIYEDQIASYDTMAKVLASGVAVDLSRSVAAFARNAGEVSLPLAYVVVSEGDAVQLEQSQANDTYLEEVDPELALLWRAGERARVLAAIAGGRMRQDELHEIPIRLRSADGERRLQIGFSLAEVHAARRTLRLGAVVVIVVALLFGGAGAVVIARPITRPVRELATALEAVARGDLDREVQVHTRDEIADLARAYESMRVGLRERQRLKGTLARYVSGEVAEKLLSEQSDLDVRGELREVTVLFLDVRGFTSLSERLPPSEVVGVLNEYFEAMVAAISGEGGIVNKFIGDSILAIWGAPTTIDEPAWRAVRAAVEVQRVAGRLGEERRRRGDVTLGIGIGISSGKAVAGNIGAAERMEYTVIGDSVNLAQRLEAIAGPGEILLAQATWEQVQGRVRGRLREPVKVKGRTEPVGLFEVEGLAEPQGGAA